MKQIKFSDRQLEAINHFLGPALVVAGPGSGKTTVITNRIINLIYQKHIKPEEILVITFSKAAAISMQSRFNQIKSNLLVTFGTFHSVFYNIVKSHNSQNKLTVANINKRRNILKNILLNLSMGDNFEAEFIDSILKRISYYKNSNYMLDNPDISSIDNKTFRHIFKSYSDMMKAGGFIDFEDMMLMCKDLLEKDVTIRERYQKLFRFILVDEFQDINNLQFDIIKLLAGKEANLFVVGDDDQSIYGFRGANPKIMFEFKDYYDAKVIKLSCNHRSTKKIVDEAAKLISHNKTRFCKDIISGNEEGAEVIYRGFKEAETEYEYILERLKNKPSNTNAAILFRNNISLSAFYESITKAGIVCEAYEKPFNPYEFVGFTDFMHYMNLALKSDNMKSSDFIPIMNKPLRYISRDKLLLEQIDLTLLKGLYKDKIYVVKAIDKLEKDLKAISRMDLFSAFHYFRNVINYDGYIRDNCADKLDVMNDIQNRLKNYSSIDELECMLEKMQDYIPKSDIEILDDGIYLMTFHGSKGLEFDHVYIPRLMEGESPSSKSVGESAIEEERRMLYVAMTRAKKTLTLTYLDDDKSHNRLRSRFLNDLCN